LNDPESELKTLLETEWSLTNDYAKENIRFHRGYVDPKIIRKPQIIIGHVRANQSLLPEISISQLEGDYRASITVYVWCKDRAIESQESAKDGKWTMMEEIQRILAKETLPSEWQWAYVEAHENRDEPLLEPPLMGEHLIVFIKYVRT